MEPKVGDILRCDCGCQWLGEVMSEPKEGCEAYRIQILRTSKGSKAYGRVEEISNLMGISLITGLELLFMIMQKKEEDAGI